MASMTTTNGGAVTRPYTSNVLGVLKSNLAGLGGYDVMALELLQNADDAGADRLSFDVRDDGLHVANSAAFSCCEDVTSNQCSWLSTGSPDSDKYACDFHRVMEVASGGKALRADNIGRFGIGFISVYQITDRPEIRSSGVVTTIHPEQQQCVIQRVPSTPGTQFTFPWATDPESPCRLALGMSGVNKGDLPTLVETFSAVIRQCLLFLRHVTHIDLQRNGTIVLTCRLSRPAGLSSVSISLGPKPITESWLLLEGDATSHLKPVVASFPILAKHNRHRDVSVAIRLDAPPSEGLFYAYLPTEQACGLPAHINADFYPESDRKQIILGTDKHENAWNSALIACAAEALAGALGSLQARLPPERLWSLIDAAWIQSRAEKGAWNAAYWSAISTAFAGNPELVLCADGHLRAPRATVSPPWEPTKVEIDLLGTIGLYPVAPALRPFVNVLGALGAKTLSVSAVAAALQEHYFVDNVQRLSDPAARAAALGPVWSVLNNLLERTPNSPGGNAVLSTLPLGLSTKGSLLPFKELARVPKGLSEKALQASLPELPLQHRAVAGFGLLKVLSPELTFELVTAHLEVLVRAPEDAEAYLGSEVAPLRGFYELLGTLAQLEDPASDTVARLKDLPVFSAGTGFVTGNEALIAGDFDDPLATAAVIRPEVVAPRALPLFRDILEIEALDLGTYISDVLPAFFKKPIPLDRYSRLLKELGRHGELLNSTQHLKSLRSLPLGLCQDNRLRPLTQCYVRSGDLVDVLGNLPELWLDETHIPPERSVRTLLAAAGLSDTPSVVHLVGRLRQLAGSTPSPDALEASERTFYAICEGFDEWSDQEKVQLRSLMQCPCLPASRDTDMWHMPGTLYASYSEKAFESQARILPFRNTQRLNPRALAYLGIRSQPEPALVVRHVAHCVAHELPIHTTAYQQLESACKEKADVVAPLRSIACVYISATKRYLRPNQLYWQAPTGLGEYAFRVPDSYQPLRRFLTAVGVKDAPEAGDYLDIILDIGESAVGGTLAKPARQIYERCLSALESAVAKGDPVIEVVEERLGDGPTILTLTGHLLYPDEAIQADSAWHVEPFGGHINGMLTDVGSLAPQLARLLGIRRASDVIRPVIDQKLETGPMADLQELLRSRADLLARIVASGAPALARDVSHRAATLEVIGCRVLETKWSFSAGSEELYSRSLATRAHFDLDSNTLYVQDPPSGRDQSEYFRALFHSLLPPTAFDGIPGMTIAATLVTSQATIEAGSAALDDAGFPPLSELEAPPSPADSQELPPLTEEGPPDHVTPPEDDGQPDPAGGPAGEPEARPAGRGPREDGGPSRNQDSTTESPTPADKRGGRYEQRHRQNRRDRMVSYVSPKTGTGHTEATGNNDHQRNLAVEAAGRERVCRWETERGRIPREMPQTHPGWDIESTDPKIADVVRYIEVKAIDGAWTGFGVALSSLQFSNAQDYGDRYWLYVVENALDNEGAVIHPIQNPATKVGSFAFDTNWREVAEDEVADPSALFIPGATVDCRLLGRGVIEAVENQGRLKSLRIRMTSGEVRYLPLNLKTMSIISMEAEE